MNILKNKANANSTTVTVAVGAGSKPMRIDWRPGDTVASILKRAGVVVAPGKTPTLGERKVSDPEHTKVQAGETIVVAGKPSNG